MATPHVSAVAALVWSYFTPLHLSPTLHREPTAQLAEQDAGSWRAGRDTKFGFGLVQAKAADDRIVALGCGN